MIIKINDYLDFLDKVLDDIPKFEDVLIKELINTSYGLVKSKKVLVDIQYIDYIICYMLKNKYINYDKFLQLGKKLENIIVGLKIKN